MFLVWVLVVHNEFETVDFWFMLRLSSLLQTVPARSRVHLS